MTDPAPLPSQPAAPATKGGFDIGRLETLTKSEQGVKMELIHPVSMSQVLRADSAPVTITLLGANSEAFREAQRQVQDRRAARVAKGAKTSSDDVRSEDFHILMACTVDWTFDQLDGQPFPYSRDNCRKFWSDRRFDWIFRAAIIFIVQEGNFLADSSGG